MFGLFKKAPKLEMAFTPKTAVARELAKEVEVAGELVVKNVGSNVEIEDDSGAITVATVQGSLRIREDDSGSIFVQNVRKDVVIDDDGSGGIDVADVGGNFTVGSKGSGSIDYERVAGRVKGMGIGLNDGCPVTRFPGCPARHPTG